MMTRDTFNLTGKIAVVTGASRGIGAAIARLLARHGAHVVVSSRKADGCSIVAEEIIADGGAATVIPCHVGEMEQIDRFYAELSERFGRLDVLVNNAAANPHFGSILTTDVGSFQKTIDVNIRGYFFMCLKGAQLMVQNGGGSIINVASVNGVIPGMSQGIYSITKAAIISMTKAFALECAPSGVRVNTLLPGPTDTKFASVLINTPAIREQILDHVPMKRVAQPDEMAGAVLYLASPAASYTTGSCITVDGGYLIA
jgi:NAD(P)-dependent dehydrogenase (short-subunit alcohol dehydrogenase family)